MRIIRLHEIDGTTHRGVFLAPQCLARMIGHLDDVGRKQAGNIGGGCTPQLSLQVGLPPDQGKPNIAEFARRGHRRRYGYRGPAVAAHGVDGNMEQRRHSASKKPGPRANGGRQMRLILRPLPRPPWSEAPCGHGRTPRGKFDDANESPRSWRRSTPRVEAARSGSDACRAWMGFFCFSELP